MTFTRTPPGLSNQYLFFHVDALVLVEGGEDTFSFTQVQAGSFGSQSDDILFWQKMFSLFIPKKKFRFKTVGSKATLKKIAYDIKSGKISHVYVAMDRDHDKITGQLIQSSGVLYTYGYGWENDVFIKPVIKELFVCMCPVSLDDINYDSEINTIYDQFSRDIKWAVYADILLSKHQLSFFPRNLWRNPPQRLLKYEPDGRPVVDRQKIHKLFKVAKVKRHSKILFNTKIQYCPSVDCYCHFLSTYCYKLLTYLLKKYSTIPELPKHYAYSMAIDQFIKQIQHASLFAYYQHYQSQFSIIS